MTAQPHGQTRAPIHPQQVPERALFLYDGTCPTCRAGVAWLLRRGGGRDVDFRPYQECDHERRMAGLSLADCDLAAALVEPRPPAPLKVHRGAEAIGFALLRLPGLRSTGWRWLGLLCSWPVARLGAAAVYRWVADRRFRSRS